MTRHCLAFGIATLFTTAPAQAAEFALPPEQAVFQALPQKDPAIACALSFAVNGAGQFYNHESSKGWWMLGTLATYPLAWALDSALQTGAFRAGSLGLILVTKGYSMWDAHSVATAQR